MSNLIARLEQVTEPDRELDAEIECELRRYQAYEVGIGDKHRSRWRPIGGNGEVIDHQNTCRYHSPEYTRSFDAALMLAPKGASIHAHIFTHYEGAITEVEVGHNKKGASALPAVAACIAGLRAREWAVSRASLATGERP